MYIPDAHRWEDPATALDLIEAHPLGAWVSHRKGDSEDPVDDALVAHHLPFHLNRHRGRWGTLVGHVARANPVWRALPRQNADSPSPHGGRMSLVMFQGPQAYISPSWYPGRQAHGRVVPTWNYAAVHVRGQAWAVDDRAWLLRMLQQLTDRHESAGTPPWAMDEAPADYIDAMLRAVVGIEIPIERIEAKFKASQDEAPDDRQGTVTGLKAQGSEQARAVAAMVEAALSRRTPPAR